MKKFIVLCLLSAVLLPASVVLGQEKTRVAAAWKVAITRSDTIIISETGKHTLALAQYKILSETVNEGTSFGDFAEGTINAVEDFIKGTGTSHGYNVLGYGDTVVLAKWSGEVKTSASGVITSEGTWVLTGGPFEGGGTYTGKFTSPDDVVIEWKGEYNKK